jgi:hypothetical protein
LISGFKNIDIETIVVDDDRIPLTIKEWLLTVPDYNNRKLFLQVAEITDNIADIQLLATNLTIANKWARHSDTHISRVLHESDISLAFETIPSFSHEIEFWEPPTKPDIKFISNTRNPTIPQSINGQSISPTYPTNQHKKQINDTDNVTTTTSISAWSTSQNEISDLHSNSRQTHLSSRHGNRMQIFDKETSTTIKQIMNKLDEINKQLMNLDKSNEYLQEEMQTMATILPKLTTTITQQQALLSNSIEKTREYRTNNSNCIRNIQTQQHEQQQKISQLELILQSWNKNTPPTSINRIWKKQKPSQTIYNNSFEDQSDDDNWNLPSTQLEHLLRNQSNLSRNDLNQSTDSMPCDDKTNDNHQSSPDMDTQSDNQDNNINNLDLGNHYPEGST